MTRLIIADDQTRARLAKVDEPELVCTPDGTVLGYFVPSASLTLTFPPQITEEEIAQRIAAAPGRKLKDIFSAEGNETQGT